MEFKLQVMKKYLIIALIIMGVVIYIGWGLLSKQRAETERYRNNYESASEGLKSFKVRDSLNGVEKIALELTASEFKHKYSETAKLLTDAGLKINHLKGVVTIKREVVGSGKTIVRDTLVLWDSLIYSKSFAFNDKFAYICGEIVGDSITVKYTIKESITVAITPIYKKVLWVFKKRTKHDKITVISANPNALVNDVELIYID